MSKPNSTALTEWRSFAMLPIAAAFGYATSVIHIYGLGPYIQPISESFDWSRTQVTVGLTIATLIQAVLAVPVGLAVDRFGPRILGVIGVCFSASAFAFLGTANGSETQWYGLWLLMAMATLPVQATVWTSAVASRFNASRGLAFAVTLCGASVAQAIFPYLAANLIESFGWQRAFMLHALAWFALAFPIIFYFFRGAKDAGPKPVAAQEASVPAEVSGVNFLTGLRSTIYLRLFITSLMLTFAIVALSIHFVPLLTAQGAAPTTAAAIASLIGISSIVGRLGTGVLIDRYQASHVGGFVFLLPALGALCLLYAGADGAGPMLAAVLIGLTLGAEVDVIVYILTRHFGLKSFGALYGALLTALSIGTAIGPLAASQLYDRTGSYSTFLWATVGLMLASSTLLFSLPKPAEHLD